jgi:hypothetical protein
LTYLAAVNKARIIFEIVTLLQGTPVDEFARQNLFAEGDRVVVKCARTTSIDSPDGQICKRAMATALRRYSYRFTLAQLLVLADLYATALEQLEPQAVARVRARMAPVSEEAQRDAAAAMAVCERLSMDYRAGAAVSGSHAYVFRCYPLPPHTARARTLRCLAATRARERAC